MTKFLVITDDAGPDEIREAITHLRAKAKRACIESTRVEIGEDVDELLDRWMELARQPASSA